MLNIRKSFISKFVRLHHWFSPLRDRSIMYLLNAQTVKRGLGPRIDCCSQPATRPPAELATEKGRKKHTGSETRVQPRASEIAEL